MVRGSGSGTLRKKALAVNATLTSTYGRKIWCAGTDPLDTLIETILSQNTSDQNSHRAFEALRKRYHDWQMLLDVKPSQIASVIRSGGLADVKAKRIVGALERINSESGCLDLGFLSDMSVRDASKWLTSIDGVGPKTAAIVLLFSFGRPAFPVDTHVYRVSGRLGLLSRNSTRESAQSELEALIPEKEYYNMHLNLIEHGRRRCKARNPGCSNCELLGFCSYKRKPRVTQP
jgi:endonuclease-3